MPVTFRMTLHSKIRDYDVHFTGEINFLSRFKGLTASVFVVDSKVWEHHSNGCLSGLSKTDVVILPVSEERKCLETVQELYDRMMPLSAKRNLTVVSIGGGITQDITGFLASTLYRGVNWVFIPTTLLAQADSCIGSKTSLNYKHYKNSIGTFYPPSEVHIYPPFLLTQEKTDFFSGLGEVAKLHIMGGKGSTNQMIAELPLIMKRDPAALLNAIKNSLLIKQSYIEGDEFDTGRRNLLNYGHCFGHALESASDFAIPHGQAVALGMLLANSVAKKRGVLSTKQAEFFTEKLLLPVITVPPDDLCLDGSRVIEAMKQDKKRTGSGLALVMIDDRFELTKVNDMSESEALNALAGLRAGYGVA